MIPCSMARRSWTSVSNAPSVPRSRSVVMPALRVVPAWATARAIRRPSGSLRTWSSHSVSLYGCRKRCECPSISPGQRGPGQRDPFGACRHGQAGLRTGRFDLPAPDQDRPPLRGASAVPSHTALGTSSTGRVESGAGAAWAGRRATAQVKTSTAVTMVTMGRMGRTFPDRNPESAEWRTAFKLDAPRDEP